MMKKQIKLFLNDEEEADVNKSISDLLKHPDWEFVESGGFGVKIDTVLDDGLVIFDVYRIVATVEVKKKKRKKKQQKG